MTCEQLKMDLSLAALGALNEAELARVRQHVESCQECAVRLREYEAVCGAQRNAAEEIHTVSLRRSDAITVSKPAPNWSGQFARWLLPAAGLGAMAAVLVLALRAPGPATASKEPTFAIGVTDHAQPSVRKAMTVATLGGYRQALIQEGASSLEARLERDADVLLPSPSSQELRSLTQAHF